MQPAESDLAMLQQMFAEASAYTNVALIPVSAKGRAATGRDEPWDLVVKLPNSLKGAGRTTYQYVIAIDWDVPDWGKWMLFNHELGHVDYMHHHARADWNDEDNEYHASVFGAERDLAAQNVQAIHWMIIDFRLQLEQAVSSSTYLAAGRRFMASKTWGRLLLADAVPMKDTDPKPFDGEAPAANSD